MWCCCYRSIRVFLPFPPRKGVCEACGRKGRTQRHHWKYAFKNDEVAENPELVLKYTNEYCFSCHRLADVLRKWFAGKGEKKTQEIIHKMFKHIEEAKKEYAKESKTRTKSRKTRNARRS